MSFCLRLPALTLALSLTACGFHLRTYNFESSVESYALAGRTQLQVVEPLRQGLRQAGVREASRDAATLVLELMDQRNERRSVSTAGQAQAAEYQVIRAVLYQIHGPDGQLLAPPTWVERERVFRIDRDNIVGSSEEQALLERELTQDLVSQLIRAMDAVSRNLTGNAG